MYYELISPDGSENLNIESIRAAFKKYLIDNSVIQDVNYEGSNASIFIDIISYAILNINATHAMLSNQTLLPLSTIRQNIIQLATTLGYGITRNISSKMSVTLSYTLAVGQSVTIPAYSEFKCGDYKFMNTEDILLTNSNPSAVIDIIEGELINSDIDSQLLFSVTEDTEKFTLGYKFIENDSIRMYVKKTGEAVWSDAWTSVDSLLSLDITKNNYYEEYDVDAGWVNIYSSFGGSGYVFGNGDQVKFEFIISNGSVANGISSCQQNFILLDNFGANVSLSIAVNSASRSGQDEESDSSIKSNAPLFYNSGNRSVNETDYESFLENSSLVEKASSWGGELHIPEKLGYIFFSAIPQDVNSLFLSNLEEAELLSILSEPRIISTVRKFWQPSYFYIDIDVKILGNVPDVATKQNLIITQVTNYFVGLDEFKTSIYESKIIKIIEEVFSSDPKSSVNVTLKPRLMLAPEMFVNNINDTAQMMTYIPNSSKRYYLVKGSDQIHLPENDQDLVSYFENGWTKQYVPDEDLDITFSGSINAVAVTTGAAYVDGLITKKDILYGVTVVGYFDVTNSILYIDETFKTEVTENQFLSVNYNPYFNVKFKHNSSIKLGNISYV